MLQSAVSPRLRQKHPRVQFVILEQLATTNRRGRKRSCRAVNLITAVVDRVLDVISGAVVTIDSLTIRHSLGDFSRSPQGGGIYNQSTLTVSNSTISGNTAVFGGGILNRYDVGVLTVINSTISGNTAIGSTGGGINNGRRATLTVMGSTMKHGRQKQPAATSNRETWSLRAKDVCLHRMPEPKARTNPSMMTPLRRRAATDCLTC